MKYRYRNESEMKDSGVEWIGKIPKDWTVSRIDKEFKVRNEKVSDKEYPPLSVTKKGILPQLENVAKSDNSDNRKMVCVGDFVINSRADRKGSCGVSSYDGSVSLICNVLTSKKLCPQYVHSLFRNYYFSEEFYRWGSGIVDDLWSTNIEKMKKISIPIPSKNEDEKIANFLDEKTSQFDLIISKKEELIKKLEEAKKSLISEVVTGKVKVVKTDDGYEIVKRSSEEMKDSGVEWLGDIPKDWEYGQLKYLCGYITDGAHISPEIENGVYPFLSVKDLKNGLLDFDNCLLTSVSNYEYLKRNSCNPKPGDVLISKDGTIGKTVTIDYDKDFVVASSLVILTPIKGLESKYFEYLLNSNISQEQISSFIKGAALPRISITHLKEIFITFTRDMNVQRSIVEYLSQELERVDNILYKIKQQIEKLKEAKQSLISEAVTGKIEILD
ncbi:restriction endonuclease subunit S [Romboutsia sp. 1001216sp1]|uniref:restriction endonuclease subunit S n=1 Tax=unclassified Romboutsia TaxID=2626894 RepID=UPI0018A97981|nr:MULTISPECIES: restriction endonuclease subunit S [unclassified Romboutsia]MDB8792601.1 restriction endonuclease subunit S [Romboutsia sp. 1001216sp1]MDB8796232.1 restriction endonuclease subunit S [Romboutsia sp. 1001216sp1]MDB8798225.1 restriction endonuclease subunit S [Romboutsia sp. 1001216sp1]